VVGSVEDLLCVLVTRVPDYRSRGSGFDSMRNEIFFEVVAQVLGPLSLIRIIEELFGINRIGSGLENRD
jgi:hypothetical protein